MYLQAIVSFPRLSRSIVNLINGDRKRAIHTNKLSLVKSAVLSALIQYFYSIIFYRDTPCNLNLQLGYLKGRIAADILSICLLPIMVFYSLCRFSQTV